jgi:hypothetical protein
MSNYLLYSLNIQSCARVKILSLYISLAIQFRDPHVTLALLFPLPFSLSVLISFSCNPVFCLAMHLPSSHKVRY